LQAHVNITGLAFVAAEV